MTGTVKTASATAARLSKVAKRKNQTAKATAAWKAKRLAEATERGNMDISVTSKDDPITAASDDKPMDSMLHNNLQSLEEEIEHDELRISILETPEPQ